MTSKDDTVLRTSDLFLAAFALERGACCIGSDRTNPKRTVFILSPKLSDDDLARFADKTALVNCAGFCDAIVELRHVIRDGGR